MMGNRTRPTSMLLVYYYTQNKEEEIHTHKCAYLHTCTIVLIYLVLSLSLHVKIQCVVYLFIIKKAEQNKKGLSFCPFFGFQLRLLQNVPFS